MVCFEFKGLKLLPEGVSVVEVFKILPLWTFKYPVGHHWL